MYAGTQKEIARALVKKTKNKRSEFLGSSLVMPFGHQSRGLRDREELSTVFLLWLECRLMTKGAHGST